jgi:hypothetical protein
VSLGQVAEDIAPAVPLLVKLLSEVFDGGLKPGDVARRIVGIGLAVVPHDELARYLTDAGRDRGDLIADIAEQAKFDDDLSSPELDDEDSKGP